MTDYFALFGVPRQLNLSLADLQLRFYDLSRELHPDRFARKPEAERQRALDASSQLNDAYRTLKDPLKRAEYILALEGFDIGEQGSKNVPPELLEEVFELNMALEEMRAGDESARPQIESARSSFNATVSDLDRQLEQLFVEYDALRDREKLSEIRAVLNRRRYISNLLRSSETL